MTVQAIEKINEKIDHTVAGGTEIQAGIGGVKFATMLELMEFAKLMSVSDLAVPPHLRGNPGACLAVCTKAIRNGFDPFALAEHSYAMSKETEVTKNHPTGGRTTEKEKVLTIAYDSAVIRAVIEAHAPIVGKIKYEYAGEGDDMTCTASAKLRETGETVSITSPTLGQRKAAIGTSDRGNLKGSPLWISKPKQQIGYDTGRDLCRLYFPEVLLGWYDKDEFEETSPQPASAAAKDKAAGPKIGQRLKGNQGDGFSQEGVTKALEHTPGAVVPAAQVKEPAKVEIITPEGEVHPQLDLGADVQNEITAKKDALANIDTAQDLTDFIQATTDYLKEAGRTDLLADFLGAAKKREQAIARKAKATAPKSEF